jgi:CPA2 family monovalent cation:H+ antiporter-2
VVVLILVALPALAAALGPSTASASGEPLWKTLAITGAKVAAFIALMVIVGKRLFPRLLWAVARSGSRELFTLAVISAAVGVAVVAAQLFCVSVALGAFFAGMMLRESTLSHRAAEESLPLRDAFSVLFFVSVGLLVDPAVLVRDPAKVVVVMLIVMAGKTVAAVLLVLALRYPLNTALTVGASLAQIGEFSFMLAGLGVMLGLLPQEGQNLILVVAIISIAANPLVFAAIEPVQGWIRTRSERARAHERSVDPLAELPASVDQARLSGHVLLVGYGRVGRRIAAMLVEQGIPFVVAEQHREVVERLRERNIPAVSGDAGDPGVLIQAHVHRAGLLVVAAPDPLQVRRMVEVARTLNPRINVVLRTHSDEEAELLRREGLGTVFMGEEQLAKAMSAHILAHRPGASSSAPSESVLG